jgi:allantoin racemase
MRIMFLSQSPEGPSEKASKQRVEALLNSYASPGTVVEQCYPDDVPGARVYVAMGGQSVLTGLHHAMLTPALIKKIFWAQEQGYDAVIQSNTFDPAVEPSRGAVRIPVIGLFRTAIHTATMLADRVGLTVPLEGHVPYTWRILRTYGMQHFVSDIKPIGIYGADLQTRKGELLGRTVEIMRGLVDDGAELILPLGGALFPYTVDPADLEKEVGVPVLNTKAIGIRFAETCVQFGMTQSPRTYPGAQLRYEDFGSLAYSP